MENKNEVIYILTNPRKKLVASNASKPLNTQKIPYNASAK